MLAIIRVKGELHLPKEKKRTLELLRLFKANHLVLAKEKPELKEMLRTIESIVTFGEINEETMELLLEKRGMLTGNKKIDEAFLKKKKIASLKELAKAIALGKSSLEELEIKPVFRLHAPRKGFERAGIKKAFSDGGAVGYRAQAINDLIKKMA